MILGGAEGHLQCRPIPVEQDRLATLLLKKLGVQIEGKFSSQVLCLKINTA